jgi:hypothetical protein
VLKPRKGLENEIVVRLLKRAGNIPESFPGS